jgi:hypothetical protein
MQELSKESKTEIEKKQALRVLKLFGSPNVPAAHIY